MTPYADLHCHTTFSDGSCTPDEILDLAVQKGLKGLSITDHDTVAAYEGLEERARAKGLKLLTGVEFSTTHAGESVHILGYGFDLASHPLLELIERHKNRRGGRNRAILEKLARYHMPISEEEILQLGHKVIGRPHIALAMVKKGYVENPQEAFRKYLAEGKLCWSPGEIISTEETIAIIKEAGGKAILAHPHLLNNPPLLQQLLKLPFDGMECTYANFPPEKNKRWIDLCERKQWLQTGGSDFHGTLKPQIAYGASYVTEAQFQLLF